MVLWAIWEFTLSQGSLSTHTLSQSKAGRKNFKKHNALAWHMLNFLGTLFNFFNCPLKQSIQWVTVTIIWKLRRLNNEYTPKAKYTAWKIKFLIHVWSFLFISQCIDGWLLDRCQEKWLAFDRFVFQYKNMA